ncbi:MAG TPA: L,D-transpeptidase family protein [Rhizomicrobium sp.]|nr:L,D-transpeptidase family protein [Rhizomicrobium sp.]
MPVLKQLSALYMVAALAFCGAIVLDRNPPLARAADAGAHAFGVGLRVSAVLLDTHILQPGWALAKQGTAALSVRIAEALKPAPEKIAAAKPETKSEPQLQPQPKIAKAEAVKPQTAPPALRPKILKSEPAPEKIAQAAPAEPVENFAPIVRITPKVKAPPAPKLAFKLAPRNITPKVQALPDIEPPPVTTAPPNHAQIVRVEQRLRDSLTDDMLQHFALFLYVSKAEQGPWAQRMYVFAKQDDGDLSLLHAWPVSTGREKIEYNAAGRKLPSFTPRGYYELDPHRMYPHYRSIQWDQPMPYAMFFNWVHDGLKTGLAIHGASGEDIGLLGMRASAGCIRLAPENAKALFKLVRTRYAGLVPKFAYDKKTATMSNDGVLLHDRNGNLKMTKGYKVLVFVENYGGTDVVAALF